jgi:Zn-dependent protease
LLSIDFAQVFIAFLVLLFSLTVHEAAHAWSAQRLGDATAKMLGRVSLNPAVHVDPIGTVIFPLMSMLTGLPLIGWAKPVPVNILNLRHHWKEKYMLIAAAGPASNIVLALIAAIVFRLMPNGGLDGSAVASGSMPANLLLRMVDLNVLLAVFNMVPVPPLDGGNVLAGILRGPVADTFDRLRPYGFLILYGLLLTGLLWTIVGPVHEQFIRWLL